MNDTNITLRQRLALNLVSGSDGLSRQEIQNQITKTYPVSKITLVRDLNILLDKKLIKLEGKGKRTRYHPFSDSPLLRYFDIESYFSVEPDKRQGAKTNFDPSVFSSLKNLFSQTELDRVREIGKSFTRQTKSLPAVILKQELERFVIEFSWKSSKIEGNTYTLLETEALIKEEKEAQGKSKQEAMMILNHKLAFEQILKKPARFKKITLSEVNQLHNLMVKNLKIPTGIRGHAVGIIGTVYRPLDNQHQTREALEQMIDLTNKTKEPLEKGLIVNLLVSYIQPYADGNKRTGRMLSNAVLLAFDHYPLSYRSVDEEDFKKALILFYEQGSLYHFKKLFLEQLAFSLANYFQ